MSIPIFGQIGVFAAIQAFVLCICTASVFAMDKDIEVQAPTGIYVEPNRGTLLYWNQFRNYARRSIENKLSDNLIVFSACKSCNESSEQRYEFVYRVTSSQVAAASKLSSAYFSIPFDFHNIKDGTFELINTQAQAYARDTTFTPYIDHSLGLVSDSPEKSYITIDIAFEKAIFTFFRAGKWHDVIVKIEPLHGRKELPPHGLQPETKY